MVEIVKRKHFDIRLDTCFIDLTEVGYDPFDLALMAVSSSLVGQPLGVTVRLAAAKVSAVTRSGFITLPSP